MNLKFSKGQLITGGIAAVGLLANKLLNGLDATNQAVPNTPYIWKFVEHDSIYSEENVDEGARAHGYGPAPDLIGVSQTAGGDTIDHVDIVNDFPWTQSPQTSRWDVPVMMLREKRIQVNPQLNQIANNLFVAAEKGGRGAQQIINETPQDLMEKIKNNDVKAENDFGEKLLSGWKSVGEAVESAASGSGVMAAYDGLYYTKDTGFVYSIPYLQEQSRVIQNNFGGTADGKGLLGVAGNLASGAAALATSLNIADPGTYIEQPKMFQFTGREKSYSVEFPLINTHSFNDVIKNWQLLFLLVYQNSPNRLTRDLIDPPCIYEANLDGTWYSKYAYINNLSVSFMGATRRMTLPIPTQVTADGSGDATADMFNVETIIPDVYRVSLTVTELFAETQNTMFNSVNQQNRKVTVERSTIEDTTPDGVKQGLAPFRDLS